ncbi:MAG: DUF368 domain-containing protein [Planctomycetes bacterium]|nr:DUF368 domain-containing protein [Planctomycetota bacterium]
MSEAPLGPVSPPRALLGGVLMGLANLVPGISGGTMLLASGVYTNFVGAIADLTTLKFSRRAISTLLWIGIPAAIAIVLFAKPIKELVETRTWIMFAVFVGLTLGGVPVVLRMVDRKAAGFWSGALMGCAVMVWIAYERYFQLEPGSASESRAGFVLLLVAGALGASAMILPGISGAFLFIILGVYRTILGAIGDMKAAVLGSDSADAPVSIGSVLEVVAPVGIGVVVGMVGVSSLLKWALARHKDTTLGALFGLLIGSILSLWPFQRPVAPGSRFFETYAGDVTSYGIAAGLVVIGFVVTTAIDRFGNRVR